MCALGMAFAGEWYCTEWLPVAGEARNWLGEHFRIHVQTIIGNVICCATACSRAATATADDDGYLQPSGSAVYCNVYCCVLQ